VARLTAPTRRHLWRSRTLRARTLMVTLLVALSPLVFVWFSDVGDATVGERMRRAVMTAAEQAARAVERGQSTPELDAELEQIAFSYSARVRIVDPSGSVVHANDHESDEGMLYQVGEFFVTGAGAPSLPKWDATQPPVNDRAVLQSIRAEQRFSHCASVENRSLLVCEAGVALPDGQVVLVQQSSRRAIRSLYDARYPILKLTMFVCVLALLAGWWLGWVWVLPLERLRDQALSRVDRPLSAPPINTPRDDEIGDLANAFDALLEAVRDRSQANEGFVADLAHEMKNPVAAIRAAAESLGSAGAIDEQRAQRLARILDSSSKRLDELVTGLLELARAEAGLHDQERALVDLGALAAGLTDALSVDERYKAVLWIEDRTATASVFGVPGQLELALRNLLVNAASFAGDGGEVTVRTRIDGADAVLDVIDSGPGIPADALPRVFERFFTTRGDSKGTGLGLALVRAVVEAHGGSVSAQSTEGQGAVFTMRLPIHQTISSD